ncbi:MAG: hypothetical protein LBT13_01245, partial [Treponema sp.]|nr:hypothetical protein [Treponema sp.]
MKESKKRPEDSRQGSAEKKGPSLRVQFVVIFTIFVITLCTVTTIISLRQTIGVAVMIFGQQ